MNTFLSRFSPKTRSRIGRAATDIIAVLVLALLTLVLPIPDGTVKLIWTMCVFIIMAVSLNITMGCMGQLALGHCGFMAIGAYTSTYFAQFLANAGFFKDGKDPQYIVVLFLGILVGGVAAALVGFLIGLPALRLRGDYLAILTLGFGLIIKSVLDNIVGPSLLNQYCKMYIPVKIYQGRYLPLIIIITAFAVALMFTFGISKFGRSLMSIRDNEIAAAASGINTSFYKTLGFTYSAGFAGVAGVLYAAMMSSLSTANFAFSSSSIYNSTFIVVMVVMGGMGSFTGSVITGAGLVFVNDLITKIPQSIPVLGTLAQYPMLLYALLLIVFVMFCPRGIFGHAEFSLYNLIIKLKNKFPKKSEENA